MEKSLVQDIRNLKNLPANWKILPFKDVLKDVSAGNKKLKKGDLNNEGLLPVIDQGKSLIAGYTDNLNDQIKSKPPHIVFGDHTRNLKFIDFSFAMGADGTKCLQVKDSAKYDPKFIFYFLKTLSIPDTGYNRHYKYLKSAYFPIPGIKLQKDIVSILDQADIHVKLNKKLIQKYDELAQSMFLDMFGDPIVNTKGWKLDQLQTLTKKITDGEHQNPKLQEIGKNLIMAKNVMSDKIDFSNPKFVSEKDFEKFTKKCKPEKNDILLVSRGATVGRCTVVNTDQPFCLMGSVILVKTNQNLLASYLNQLFKHPNFQKQLIGVSSSSAQQAIYITHLKKLRVPNPPIQVQDNFSKKLDSIKEQNKLAKESLKKSQELFQSLLQKAFNGELIKTNEYETA